MRILIFLFLCLAAYYVYLLVNPDTHYTALNYAPAAAVVTGFVVFASALAMGNDSKSRNQRTESLLDTVFGKSTSKSRSDYEEAGGRRRRR
jgi:hypothetical protein